MFRSSSRSTSARKSEESFRRAGAPPAGAPPPAARPAPPPPPARPAPSPSTVRPPAGARVNSPASEIEAVRGATTVPIERAGGFTIQIPALNAPRRAKDIVSALKATGMPAYLVNPTAADPDAPYRVRVGPYATRTAA